LRERSVWALVGGVDVSCSTFFCRHAPTHDARSPARSCGMSFDDAFRRHRLVRARSPATIADPPWLVRSPAPASLDQNAAYRNLQHDTTREHDSPLKFDPRPSRVAFCCAPFAFAACSVTLRCRRLPKAVPSFQRDVPRRSSESRRPCDLRVPDSPRAKDLHYAGDPPRDLSEHPGSSSTCCHGSLEWFRRWLADQGPRSTTTPRRVAASRRPRVLSTVRMPPGLLPTSPSFPRAGPPSRCTR